MLAPFVYGKIATMRTRALFCVIAAALCASAAAATTLHREAITRSTGSEGASTTLQTSAKSSAIQGEVASTANTSLKIPFGVLGEYNASTSTFGIGVAGISTSGYGVAAEAFGSNPSLIAVSGGSNDAFDAVGPSSGGSAIVASSSGYTDTIIAKAANGIGLHATSSGSVGVYASSSNGTGVAGFSTSGDGVDGTSSSGDGVTGTSVTKSGLVGTATGTATSGPNNALSSVGLTASAAIGVGAIVENDSGSNAALVINNTAYTDEGGNPAAPLIEGGANGAGGFNFSVDAAGDVYANSFYSGAGNVDVVSRNPGNAMLTYAPQQSEASMEDGGSARLIDGMASVPLTADFRQTIDTSVPYAVYLTTYGDNHGLYVASRTPSGFVVREAQGGRSSLSFDYRIVAKPYGSRLARLPHFDPPTFGSRHAVALRRPTSLVIPAAFVVQADAAVARAQKNAAAMNGVRR
jgi:hypothetical protein